MPSAIHDTIIAAKLLSVNRFTILGRKWGTSSTSRSCIAHCPAVLAIGEAFFRIKSIVFWMLWSNKYEKEIIQINNFRGDLSDVSAKKTALLTTVKRFRRSSSRNFSGHHQPRFRGEKKTVLSQSARVNNYTWDVELLNFVIVRVWEQFHDKTCKSYVDLAPVIQLHRLCHPKSWLFLLSNIFFIGSKLPENVRLNCEQNIRVCGCLNRDTCLV